MRIWIVPALFLALTPAIATADLTTRLVQELRSPDTSTWEAVSVKLRGYHVVFAELQDQRKSGLIAFADHVQSLKDELHAEAPDLVSTSLYAPYASNAAVLRSELLDIFGKNGGKPLILVGNPGTGPEFLYAALKYPELVTRNVIGRIVLIMPVFGLPILRDGDALAKRHRDCSPVLDAICGEIDKVLGGKISKLDPTLSRSTFVSMVSRAPRGLSERVFYVRGGVSSISYVPTGLNERATVPRKILPYYAVTERRGRVTDGLTFVDDQKLDGFGTDLTSDLTSSGPLTVSHWDLFAANEVNTPARLRTAFTRALMAEILGVK